MSETSGPRATVETRRELLERLEAPHGSVVIARRPTSSGDVLVVRMVTADAVPPGRRLKKFKGFGVDYEIVGPIRAGHW